MTEETGILESPPTGTPTTPTITNFIGENGELKEGWKDTLPTELRTSTVYNKTPDLPSVFKQLASLDKLAGRKTTIPDDKSTEADWNAFYDSTGRPKTVDEYNLTIPKEYKEYYDEDLLKETKNIFHKIGLSKKQADAFWNFEMSLADKALKNNQQQQEQVKIQTDSIIREKLGNKYNESNHIIQMMLSNHAGEDYEYIFEEAKKDPKMYMFLNNMAGKLVEHRIITDVETPISSTDTKIDELMGKNLSADQQKKLPYWDVTNVNHKVVVEQVQRLFALKNNIAKTPA